MRSKSSGSDPTKPKNRRHLKLCPLPYEPLTEAEKKDTSDPFDPNPNPSLSTFKLYPTILDIGFESLLGKERLDLYNIPRYIKLSYHRIAKIESQSSRSGIPISAGVGACLQFGCQIISSLPSVSQISALYDEIDTTDELDFESTLSLDSALSNFPFSPQNPHSSKAEKWRLRCSEDTRSSVFDLAAKLRMKMSPLGIAAICCTLSRSPYVQDGAKKYLELTEKDLISVLDSRLNNMEIIRGAFLKRAKDK